MNKKSIAVVDDNLTSLQTAKEILKDHYRVFPIPSGEKLFELLENIEPESGSDLPVDLILLDIEMPGMSGYEVIKKLKSQNEDIPVIFLTSHGEAENELEGLSLGAIDFFQKPLSSPLLLKRIETHLLMISQSEELRHARDQAEAANRAKSAFLAHMSHEIRTPLNAVVGMSELMRLDNLDTVQKGYIKDIQDMSKSLLHIINDILDMSKIEAGKMDIEPVHFRLGETFKHLCSAYSCLAMNKDLELRSSYDSKLPEVIYGDEIRIRQVITNLLGNAVKYTPHGFVEVQIGKTIRNGKDWIAIVVSDSGIGIKKEDYHLIFDTFHQLDRDKNRHIQGTGLGLAITLELAQLMGGTIELESEYGKGSVFSFYLPLVSGDPEKIESETNIKHVEALDDIPVLVVDDNPVNLTVALGFLAASFIKAETASSGAEAVRMIEEKSRSGGFDLVFMDHMMPEMDGLETTTKIREWEKQNGKKATPIVALSANSGAGIDKMFISAGMNDYLSKPINARELNRVLAKWLSADKIKIVSTEAVSQNQINTAALRQFAENCDTYIEELENTVKASAWKDYSIKAHALKGVLAAFGEENLSKWAGKLEKSAKSSKPGEYCAPPNCKEETLQFCAALGEYSDMLHRSFFDSSADKSKINKTKGDILIFEEQMELLKTACRECSSDDAEKIINYLCEFEWNNETDKKLENIRKLVISYDFEEVISYDFFKVIQDLKE